MKLRELPVEMCGRLSTNAPDRVPYCIGRFEVIACLLLPWVKLVKSGAGDS
jgi:hypothetical protein